MYAQLLQIREAALLHEREVLLVSSLSIFKYFLREELKPTEQLASSGLCRSVAEPKAENPAWWLCEKLVGR